MAKPLKVNNEISVLAEHQLRMGRMVAPLFKAEIDGKLYEIENISESGAKIEGCDTHSASFPIRVLFNGSEVYRGEGKKVRENKDAKSIGVLFVPYMQNDMISAIKHCMQIKEELDRELRAEVELPKAFIKLISDMSNFFGKVKTKLDKLDDEMHIMSLEVKRSYWKVAENVIFPSMIKEISRFSTELHNLVKGRDEKIYQACKNYFQTHLLRFYETSAFVSRSLARPLGYAGDYMMMLQVYKEDFDGKNLFGKLMNQWAINEASSQSVRLRREYLKKRLREFVSDRKGPIVIGSLACGPAMEASDFIKEMSSKDLERITFIFMDQDQEALLEAKRNIHTSLLEKGAAGNAYIVPISVKKILQDDPMVQEIRKVGLDFIYTAGLYDYLEQPLAKELTKRVVKLMKYQGEIIIGNYHPDNPSQTIGDFCGNWRLIHRDESMMHDLFEDCPISERSLYFDKLKIDSFLNGRKDEEKPHLLK